jgi:hypothetical protein
MRDESARSVDAGLIRPTIARIRILLLRRHVSLLVATIATVPPAARGTASATTAVSTSAAVAAASPTIRPGSVVSVC